ncbi:glycosyltransferase family 2 protein [Lactococcus petauri]|uniref:glycosyltransferase family 2 protein n=1 Tax=Lactococcus petauri TaxID=1940789 RepID=UPI00254B3234|nr:glycosyltransferase [Lactococcus petauri]
MKFSIIIPVYNSEKYIEKCVSSITHQTHQDLEILLIDDGSTDNSGNICDELSKSDSRIRTIHQENGGTSKSRNTGLKEATGDYVMFMDNDDLWSTKNGLTAINNQLLESKADVLIFDSAIERNGNVNYIGKSDFSRDKVLKQPTEVALKELIIGNKLVRAVWTKVIKNDLIKKFHLEFPVGMRNEDTAFTADLITVAQSYDWYNYYFYIWIKTGVSQTSKRVSLQSMKDLEEILVVNFGRALKIENLELKKAFLSYLSYPYVVLLGQVKEYQKQDKTASLQLIRNLKQYKFILNIDGNPTVKKIKYIYRIFGFNVVVYLLGRVMSRKYRTEGI